MSWIGSRTANGDAETEENERGHASLHGKKMQQENAYGQRSTMTKSSAKAQSPTEADNL